MTKPTTKNNTKVQKVYPMKNIIIFLCLFTLSLLGQYQPVSKKGELIKHTYYTLSYVEEHEQANWVYYQIREGGYHRKDDFRIDEDVSTGSATLEDYEGSNLHRGHMCPAAAMGFSKQAISETFCMSNISPQFGSFNRGIWKTLENRVRNLSIKGTTHVVTGPIFRDNIKTIGDNKVTVPGYYYNVQTT